MNNSTTKQKKLLICADSFCAEEDLNKEPWAWWNLLARDLNAKTTNLAISGASNFNIFLQLEEINLIKFYKSQFLGVLNSLATYL